MRTDGDGTEILSHIIETNAEFRVFYEEEFKKKIGYIGWVEDPGMPRNLEAYYHKGEGAIHYRVIPVSIKDAYIMAHEMMHSIRAKESDLLQVRYKLPQHENLAGSLNSLPEDPIVDRILRKKYNIDLQSCCLQTIEDQKGRIKRDPADCLERTRQGFVHAIDRLRWDLIDDHDAWRVRHDYLKECREQSPFVYKIGKKTADIVRRIGLDSIEQKKMVINKLIDKYGLYGIIMTE